MLQAVLTGERNDFDNLPLGNTVYTLSPCVFAFVEDNVELAALASEAIKGVLLNAVFHSVTLINGTVSELSASPGLGPLFLVEVCLVKVCRTSHTRFIHSLLE